MASYNSDSDSEENDYLLRFNECFSKVCEEDDDADNEIHEHIRIQKILKDPNASINQLPDHMKDNEAAVRICIEKFPISLKFASNRLKNERDIVLFAMKKDTRTLRYASHRLRSDPQLCKMAVKEYPTIVKHLGVNIINNVEFAKFTIALDPNTYELFPVEIRNNDEVISQYLLEEPAKILKPHFKRFLVIKENVIAAIPTTRQVCQLMSDDLKEDLDVAECVGKNWGSYYVQQNMLTHNSVIKACIEYCPQCIFLDSVFPPNVLHNIEILKHAFAYMRKDDANRHYFLLPDDIKNDVNFSLWLIEKDTFSLECFTDKIKNNFDVIFEAIKFDVCNANHMNERFFYDPRILSELVKSWYVFIHVSKFSELYADNRTIARRVIQNSNNKKSMWSFILSNDNPRLSACGYEYIMRRNDVLLYTSILPELQREILSYLE